MFSQQPTQPANALELTQSCLAGSLQLFQMLGFKTSGPNAISKETVTLTHFLNVADLLVKQADAIKALDAQAQGESMLRKALAELKLWGLQREFAFGESTSSVSAVLYCCVSAAQHFESLTVNIMTCNLQVSTRWS